MLVDQRGTGASNLLDCPEDADALYLSTDARDRPRDAPLPRGALRARRASRSTRPARGRRTSSACAPRSATSASTSTGSPTARASRSSTCARYPARVRAVILDGVVPPSLVLGPAVAHRRRARACPPSSRAARPTAPCHARFPDPAPTTRAVRAALSAHPVPVSVPDPSTGAPRPFSFGPDQLALVLRLGSYASEYAALLPLLLHTAAERGLRAARRAVPAAEALLRGRRHRHAQQRRVRRGRAVHTTPRPSTAPRSRRPTSALASSTVCAVVCGLWPRGPVTCGLARAAARATCRRCCSRAAMTR